MHASSPRRRSATVLWWTKALSVLLLVTVTAGSAAANPKYAGFVYDVIGEKELYAEDVDEMRYPASLTKIMTLYIVFEELAAGRITLDTKFTMSEHASKEPPSKIGIKPGGTMAVRDAIKALVTKSANDVAAMVAENISGSVPAFTKRMTRTAHRIGMPKTTFTTPSGLPDPGNKTTARDMVTLGIAIQRDFPQYYGVFSTRVFEYGKRRYGNHNRLLGRVEGVDGIKTGYIRASGFNLVTSVRRDGRHIVAVVMGGRTGASRDNQMAELIARYLPKAEQGAPMLYAAWSDFGPPPLPRIRPTLAVRFASRIETREEKAEDADAIQTILAFAAQTRATVPSPSDVTPVSTPLTATDALQAVIGDAQAAPAPSAEPLPSRGSTEIALGAHGRTAEAEPIQLAAVDPATATGAIASDAAPASQNAGARFGDVFAVFSDTGSEPDDTLRAVIISRTVPTSGVTIIAMGSAPQTAGERAPLDPGSGKNTARMALAPVVTKAASAPAAAALRKDARSDEANEDRRAAAQPTGPWQIQLGAVTSEAAASTILAEAERDVPAMAQQARVTLKTTTPNGTVYRARFGGFRSEADAVSACKRFTNHNRPCWAVSM